MIGGTAAFSLIILVAVTFAIYRKRKARSHRAAEYRLQSAASGRVVEPIVSRTQVEASLKAAGRPFWKPILAAGEDSRLLNSHFGGVPLLRTDEQWPVCANCGQEMPLFVQLDSEEMPKHVAWNGLLQLFYCTNTERECEVECEAWAPWAKSTLLRVLAPDALRRNVNQSGAALQRVSLDGWEQRVDYPSPEDYAEAHIEVPDPFWDEMYEAFHPAEGDKLLGWPSWVQSAEYCQCPTCGARMTVTFQLASKDNVPYMFGDLGTGHISICSDHPDKLAFAWACS